MIVKTSIGFLNNDTDAQLVVDVQSAISGMTGNPNFATPSPALASITTALNAFTVALADAANGGTELTSIKNAKRAELVSLMRQLASYVTVTCDGDMTKMLSSGFIYQKPTRSKIGQLPAPGTPVVKQGGVSGQLNASTPPIYGASSYNWSVANEREIMVGNGEKSGEVTALLLRWQGGNDEEATAELMPLVYDELRRVARAYLQRERKDHTLQATALVHEAYLRLVDDTKLSWKDRAHFYGIAARMMRQILIQHARAHDATKRGGPGQIKLSLEEMPDLGSKSAVELVALDDALTILRKSIRGKARSWN